MRVYNYSYQQHYLCDINAAIIYVTLILPIVYYCSLFFQHDFCVKPYVPREPRNDRNDEMTEMMKVIVGLLKMGFISDTVRNRTHNLFRPMREPIYKLLFGT